MFPDLVWWIGLFVVVGTLLAVDLLVMHREERATTFKEAAAWSTLWITTALAFGVLVGIVRVVTIAGTLAALTTLLLVAIE